MADTKKVLILYASAGHGHKKAAMAIESAFGGGAGVQCVDTLKYTRFGFGKRYESFYLFMIRSIPWAWGFFYYLTDIPLVYALVRPLRRLNNGFFASGVEKLIRETSPDVVISTHFLGSEVTSHMIRKQRTAAKLITVVTDYLAHSIWLDSETSVYCAACEETADDLVRRGVPRGKIFVTGLPIEPKFSRPMDRAQLRASQGIGPEQFTVLLTSGGGGAGMLEPLLHRLSFLEPPLEIIAVCGTNEPMRARLSAKHKGNDHIRVLGFVDNVQELMALSDVMVGKGGGLTITECLAMSKPMVLIGALPGQESKNVRVMVRAKAASSAKTIADAVQSVRKYQKDADFYAQALQAIGRVRRKDAAGAIAEISRGLS